MGPEQNGRHFADDISHFVQKENFDFTEALLQTVQLTHGQDWFR